MCGVGAELGQAMNEIAFDELDAPVGRLHTEPVSHPLAPSLERMMLVDAGKIVAAATDVDGRPRAGALALALSRTCRGHAGRGRCTRARSQHQRGRRASAAEAVPSRPRRRDGRRADHHAVRRPHGQRRHDRALGEVGRRHRQAGELVAEIETDKAVVEIEAPVAGMLRDRSAEGTVVPMGGRIGVGALTATIHDSNRIAATHSRHALCAAAGARARPAAFGDRRQRSQRTHHRR